MNTKNILELSYLDILFQNKYKEYGAYELRTHYDERVKRATILTSVSAIVLLTYLAFFAKPGTVSDEIFDLPGSDLPMVVTDVVIPKPKIVSNTGSTHSDIYVVVDEVKPKPNNPEEAKPNNGTEGPSNFPVTAASGGGGETSSTNVVPNVEPEPIKPKPEKDLYVNGELDIEPEFPGGEDALIEKISSLLVYPQDAIENEHAETVVLEFVVTEDGSIKNIGILKGQYESCKKEAKRVMQLLPKWKPGKVNGKPVKSVYKMPIRFAIVED